MPVLAQPHTHAPPGPAPKWLFGNLKEFGRDQLGTMTRWAREYGDLVSARFGPKHVVFANHPDLVEEVLVNQNRRFIKHYRLRQTRRTLGHGLLTSEGEFCAASGSWPSRRFIVSGSLPMPGSWQISPSECSSPGPPVRSATSTMT